MPVFESENEWVVVRREAEMGCEACQYELEELGPVYGPERPPVPRFRVERWSMSPREWAGEG